MKIGFDIDDVLLESMRGYIEEWNKRFEKNLKFEEADEPHFWKKQGIDFKEAINFFDDFFEEKAYSLNFISNAKEAVLELSKNHEIIFVTSRPSRFGEKTKQFFEKHFPEISFKIFHSDENNFSKTGKRKLDICLEQEIDLLIEDQLDYAAPCSSEGIPVFLFDRPWNQQGRNKNGLIRVSSWKEILEKIKEIENGN